MFSCVSCGSQLHFCNSVNFRDFKLVTSDCREFEGGGDLCNCLNCGLLQRPRSEIWRKNCQEIYAQYEAHRQGGGEEQQIFEAAVGQSRSSKIVSRLLESAVIKNGCSWLDYGCGEGHFLESLSSLRPDISLTGTDYRPTPPSRLRSFGKIDYFSIEREIVKSFDWISLIHVVEHFFEPLVDLRRLHRLLRPEGHLFIQVPNLRANPFDLIIIDHGTFFIEETICAALMRAGFSVEFVTDGWVNKELSIIASVGVESDWHRYDVSAKRTEEILRSHHQFLSELRTDIQNKRQTGDVTIFGSSIGATWAAIECGKEYVLQFVDEDISRQNSLHLNIPINEPDLNISNVIVPLEERTRRRIEKKYNF
jgi:2-polyprenyl-3-methyl-5-hydroxy-6-metoxy-1,4-benzoquinol methylase